MISRVASDRPSSELDQQLAELLAEAADKLRAGEPVDLSDYVRRYPDFAERLEQLLPAMRTLAELGQSQSSVPSSVAGRGQAFEEVRGTLGDFRILREIGRGGMGVVYEAEQVSLGRRMALKVLPFAGVLDERQLTRFRNEARAAASLKHPNIVGVHSVGCERGVHYYAMEFIEGRTLAEVIAELRQESAGPADMSGGTDEVRQPFQADVSPEASRTACADDRAAGDGSRQVGQPFQADVSLERLTYNADTDRQAQAKVSTHKPTASRDFFRRVAEWGIQAAEGLEHAHEMGIVHRDIKPSNLLVDASGHLWITDFGLAQILAPSPVAGEGWGEGGCLTMTGDLLGTLRYMSPEQAAGRSRVLDHRTDVYSLGVTLYELLTLRPPFSGDDRQDVLRQIGDDEPPALRQLNRSIPRDLETIVLKAMSKEPPARYATAHELTDDLKRFLADEPIRARRPRLADRAAKWARRHKPVVLAAALLLVIATAASAAATVLIWRAKQQTVIALHDTEVETARANAVIDLLQQMLSSASPYGPEGRDLTVRQLLDEFSVGIGDRLKGHPEVEAPIRALIGRIYGQLRRHEEAVVHTRAAIERYRELGNEEKLADCLIDHAWHVRTREGTDAAREALAIHRRLEDPRGMIRALWQLHVHLGYFEGLYTESDRAFEEAATLAREHPEACPPEFASMLHFQGKTKLDRGDLQEAERLGREAVAMYRRLWGQDHPELATSLYRLGGTLAAKGDSAGAESCFREGLAAFHKRFGSHFATNQCREALEKVLAAQGKQAELEQVRRQYGDKPSAAAKEEEQTAHPERVTKPEPKKAQAVLSRAATQPAGDDRPKGTPNIPEDAPVNPKTVDAYLARAATYRNQRDWEKALAECTEAIRIDPKDCRAYRERGKVYEAKYDRDRAWADFDEACRLDPKRVEGYILRGTCYCDKGELAKALADHNEAVRIDPTSAWAREERGRTLLKMGDFDKAMAEFDEAIRLHPKHVTAHIYRARARASVGDVDKALSDLDEAVRIDPNSGWARGERALLLGKRGDLDKTLADCNEAIRVDPKRVDGYMQRGDFFLDMAEFDKAIADYTEALRLAPRGPYAIMAERKRAECANLRLFDKTLAAQAQAKFSRAKKLYFEDHKLAEAMIQFDDAIKTSREMLTRLADAPAGSPVPPPCNVLARSLAWRAHVLRVEKKDADQAIADCTEAIRCDPKCAVAYRHRGAAYSAEGDSDKAMADFDAAVRLDPTDRINLSDRVRESLKRREFDKALADVDQMIHLNPRDGNAYASRGEVHLARGDFEKAAADYDRAAEVGNISWHHYKRRAEAHFQLKNYDKALADIAKAVELEPGDTSNLWWIPPDQVAKCPDDRLRKGLLELADKTVHWAEGTTDASRATSRHGWKTAAGAYLARAGLYRAFGQRDRAVADFAKAIQLEPTNADAWASRASFYVKQRDWDPAIADLGKVVELKPEQANFWYQRALVRVAAGRADDYRKDCAEMLQRFGKANKPDDVHWAAWTCALTPDATKDWPQALALAEKAAKSDSKSISYADTWGAVLYRAGRFDESLARLSEADALAKEPSEALKSSPAYAWLFLAMAHHRLGHPDEAKKWLDKAVAWTDKAEREADEGTAELPWNRRLTLKLLRAEAAALLGAADKPPAEKEKVEKGK